MNAAKRMEKKREVLDGTRTRNLPLRRRMPYPLGHEDIITTYCPTHNHKQTSTNTTNTTHKTTTPSTLTPLTLTLLHTCLHWNTLAYSITTLYSTFLTSATSKACDLSYSSPVSSHTVVSYTAYTAHLFTLYIIHIHIGRMDSWTTKGSYIVQWMYLSKCNFLMVEVVFQWWSCHESTTDLKECGGGVRVLYRYSGSMNGEELHTLLWGPHAMG